MLARAYNKRRAVPTVCHGCWDTCDYCTDSGGWNANSQVKTKGHVARRGTVRRANDTYKR
jgi:hypothetical protein